MTRLKMFDGRDVIRVERDENEDIIRLVAQKLKNPNGYIPVTVHCCAPEDEPKWVTFLEISSKLLKPERIIYNNRSTVCIWKDGTKTVVTASEDEPFIKEVGVAMCIIKKLFGNRSEFLRIVESGYVQPVEEKKTTAKKKK